MDLLYGISILVCVVCTIPYGICDICCTPNVWKADMFWDYGLVFKGNTNDVLNSAYSYINGTVKLTYDYEKRRSYLKVQGTEVSHLFPVPGLPYDTTIINDYRKGIQYDIGSDGSCQKSTIENMKKQCIPDNAELVSSGSFIKDGNNVQNYKYTMTNYLKASVDTTISRSVSSSNFSENIIGYTEFTASCNPIHVVYFIGDTQSGSGTMINLDVLNVVPYNIDPSVFTIPPQCREAKMVRKRKLNELINHFLELNLLT